LQAEHWDPLFEWTEKTFGAKLIKHNSIIFSEQPQETREKLGNIVKGFDQWQMAGTIVDYFCSTDSTDRT
jgi:ATP synthase F1 complex assembly factor 2